MTDRAPRTQPPAPTPPPDLDACHASVGAMLQQLEPHDDLERADRERAARWVAATRDIWRREKPATPSPHLVSVRREAEEELGLREVTMLDGVPAPFFLTWTWTRAESPGRHVDVSFWFALHARTSEQLTWDRREFHSIRWWSFEEVGSADPTTLDPQMSRALTKLSRVLA